MKPLTLEVCIDSVQSALAAKYGGAHRVELCAALYEGGITPSIGMVEEVLDAVDIDVMVIIRPRGGDFLYDKREVNIMRKDISRVKSLGVRGIVIGALNEEGDIQSDVIKNLLDEAEGMDVTFHRAFDMGRNPYRMLDNLIDLGINRLLTSGQKKDAFEGRGLIAELVDRGGDDIQIMAGGGITDQNVYKIVKETGINEVHATCSEKTDGAMKFRREEVFMGVEGYPEFHHKYSTQEKVSVIIEEIKRAKS